MKRSFIIRFMRIMAMSASVLLATHLAILAPSQAAPTNTDWENLPDPEILNVEVNPQNPYELLVHYRGEVGPSGADKVGLFSDLDHVIEGSDAISGGNEITETSSKGTFIIKPSGSGEIRLYVWLSRGGTDQTKYSQERVVTFERPFHPPQNVSIQSKVVEDGTASATVTWGKVETATSYSLEYRLRFGSFESGSSDSGSTESGSFESGSFESGQMNNSLQSFSAAIGSNVQNVPTNQGKITGLKPGSTIDIRVTAHREDKSLVSDIVPHTVAGSSSTPDPTTPAPTTPAPTTPPPSTPAPTTPGPTTPDPTTPGPTTPDPTTPDPTTPPPTTAPTTPAPTSPNPSPSGPSSAPTSAAPSTPGTSSLAPVNPRPTNPNTGDPTSDSPTPSPADSDDPDGSFTLVPPSPDAGESSENDPSQDQSTTVVPGGSASRGGGESGTDGATSQISNPSMPGPNFDSSQTQTGDSSRTWKLFGMLVLIAVAISSAGALISRFRDSRNATS